MKVFILEDDATRIALFQEYGTGKDLTIAKDFGSAKELYQPPYDLMFLDHDLGDMTYVDSEDENTGYQFAKWLGKAPEDPPHVIIHSFNYYGAKAMCDLLADNGWDPVRYPFGKFVLNHLMFGAE